MMLLMRLSHLHDIWGVINAHIIIIIIIIKTSLQIFEHYRHYTATTTPFITSTLSHVYEITAE